MTGEFIESIKELVDAVEEELDFVREKHQIKYDNFSCHRFKRMAKAVVEVKKQLIGSNHKIRDESICFSCNYIPPPELKNEEKFYRCVICNEHWEHNEFHQFYKDIKWVKTNPDNPKEEYIMNISGCKGG